MVAPVTGTGEQHQVAGTRQVARGGLANLVGAAYSGLATFGATVIITNTASTENAGLYFSALSTLLIGVALAQLGTPVGYVYFLSRFRGLHRESKLRPILFAGSVPVVILGSLIIAISLAFRDPLAHLIFGEAIAQGPALVATIACALLIAIAAESSVAATRGLGVMRPTVIAEKFANPSVQLIALVALALAGQTNGVELVWTRVAGFVVVVIIAVPWLIKLLRRYPADQRRSWSSIWLPDQATFSGFWRFAGPRAFGQIAQTGVQRVDIVLVALWVGPTEAAIYAAATRFLVFGQLAANAIGAAVQPRLSTLSARAEIGPLQHLYRTSTAWIVLATWPFYLTFIVYADQLMLVFGDQYEVGALILRIISSAMLVATGCGVVDAVILMAGKSVLTMVNSWIALLINVSLNVWLIPQIGIFGAAIAWAAAILAANLIPLVQVRATLHAHPFGRITLLAFAVAATLFGLVPWLVRATGGGVMAGVFSLALAGVVYTLLLWRWRRPLGLSDLIRRPRRTRSSRPD